MDGRALLHGIAYVAGALLILLVLLDVFLTVLYARMGSSVFAHHLACFMWRGFRAVARPFPRFRDGILSFCGPCILVTAVALWIVGVMLGAALIVLPQIGGAIQSSTGHNQKTFITALYIVGDCMTTVGATDYRPQTPGYRLFYVFLSAIGLTMITLTLTYLLEIYNALQQRNTFAMKMHHATGDSGDAAELLAGVGPQGQFQAGYGHLSEMSAEVIQLCEAHHFYPVLLYFRFREPQYALSRIALINLDTITLIKSALSDEKGGWVKESAAVAQIWLATMKMLAELAIVFLPHGLPTDGHEPDEATKQRWRQRYHAGIARLRQAGIETIEHEEQGAETYVSLRARWDRYLWAFAGHMAHPMDQVDPVGSDPGRVEERPAFEHRLRAAG